MKSHLNNKAIVLEYTIYTDDVHEVPTQLKPKTSTPETFKLPLSSSSINFVGKGQ